LEESNASKGANNNIEFAKGKTEIHEDAESPRESVLVTVSELFFSNRDSPSLFLFLWIIIKFSPF
jgi:hypothetical protein